MQAECVCRRSPYMCALGASCVSNVNAAVSACVALCSLLGMHVPRTPPTPSRHVPCTPPTP